MGETENAGRAEFQFVDDVVARRAARWAIDFGIAIDIDGSTIRVDPNLAPVMRKAIECAESDRATLGTSDMSARICAQCSGGMSDGRCQSCYWSSTDIDSSDGSTPTLAARRLDGQLNRGVVVSHCALLGGSGVPLLVGAEPVLTFTEAGLDLWSIQAALTLWHVPWADLHGLWIGGSGSVTSDAGIAGGGIGLQGAATGIAAAWLINRVTRSTTVTTLLNVTFQGGELFFLHSLVGPQTLRMMLSPVFARLGAKEAAIADRDGHHERGRGGIIFVG